MPTPGYLIGFTLSPVQAFIREARKAQDIWSGSLLLSHLAQAALARLDGAGCERISPAAVTFDPARPSVTNEGVVFAADRSTADAVHLAERAAEAVRSRWRDLAARTRACITGDHLLFRSDELARWDEQIAAQFTVAWAVEPAADRDNPEAAGALRRLRRLLTAAKRTRAVAPYTGDSRPKCTLCGAWEQMGPEGASVRDDNRFWENTLRERLACLPHGNEVRWVVTARLEGGGRERLCAVCLTKRLGPTLVLGPEVGFRNHDDPAYEGRFPSTTAVAWVEAKANLLSQARAWPDSYVPVLEQYVRAVGRYCEAADLPRGRHVLTCYDPIINELPNNLQVPARRFLELDGSWLAAGEREREDERGFVEDIAALDAARRELQEQRGELHRLTRDARPRVGIGRMPPVALLRADADRMGRLSAEVVAEGGLGAASRLSATLGQHALPAAVNAVEQDCRGKVVFAGGDELIALLPAARALAAAARVSRAYEQAGQECGFPQLTCSVAVVLVHPHSPLRIAINALTDLLDEAKEYRRDESWAGGTSDRSRRSLGLAVIPGSGNVKRGVIGLHVPHFRGTEIASRPVIDEVLLPLVEAIALDPEDGVAVSPKLFREWVELFEGFDAARLEELLPDGDSEGIALAEFRRLARRHTFVRAERGQAVLSDELRATLQTRLGETFSLVPDELRQALAADLTDRMRSLLLSGSYDRDNNARRAPAWDNLRGLLLAVVTLGTREIL